MTDSLHHVEKLLWRSETPAHPVSEPKRRATTHGPSGPPDRTSSETSSARICYTEIRRRSRTFSERLWLQWPFANESEARSDPSSMNQKTYSLAVHAGTNHQVNESDAARGNI